MKILSLAQFLVKLSHNQRQAFADELEAQASDDVYTEFVEDIKTKEIEHIHFMVLPELDDKTHLHAYCVYRRFRDKIVRNITEIRVYENEVEQDFYQMLHEYENKEDPNPVLFN